MYKVGISGLPGAGKGLFATKKIKKGVIIGEYRGKHLSSRERESLKDDSYVWCLDDGTFIDGKPIKMNPLKYVNGCKGPEQASMVNVDALEKGGKIFYKAISDIGKKQEIIIDYGDDYFETTEDKINNWKAYTSIQRSVVKGLLWCVKKFEDRRFFISQSTNLIVMLQGMVCSHPRRKFNKILIEWMRHTLERMSFLLDRIIKGDASEIIPMFFSLKYVKASASTYNRFLDYWKTKVDKEIYEGDKSFRDNIATEDFDSLSSEAVDYSFLRMVKKLKLPGLPKDRFDKYWRAMKRMGFEDFERDSDLDYHATHIVFIYKSYNCASGKKDSLVKKAETYLIEESGRILDRSSDIDLISETLECMIILKSKKWLVRNQGKFTKKILKSQRVNGSWMSKGDKTMYDRFHGTWTSLGALYHLF